MKKTLLPGIVLLFLISIITACGEDNSGPSLPLTNTNILVTPIQKDINSTISEKRFQIGMIRFYNREYQAAIQIFNSALSYDPMNHQARYYLGYSFLNAGYAQNAIQEWENLLNLGGGNNQVRQKLNDLYFRLSIDKSYTATTSYVLSEIYSGRKQGMHKIIRPSFIVYDSKSDHFFISTAKTKYVVEMDGSGNVIRQIGRMVGDFSAFKMPTGIALRENNLFIADFKTDQILKFDMDGKMLSKFGLSGSGLSNISGPMGIHISDDGYIYVVDNGNNRIQKFDLKGNWVQSLGMGELSRPTDITGQGDKIFVSDSINGRILEFDAFGNLVREIGQDILQEPRGITLKNNILYIVDAKHGIYLFNLDNSEMESLNVDKGKLVLPFDICIDNKDILYNTDFNTDKIAVYIPLQLRYGNLGIDVTQIWTDHYPQNFVHFRVWDKTGKPVYDLKGGNLILQEEGENIPILRLGPTEEFRKDMFVKIVIDHSSTMERFLPELDDSLRPFLELMSGNDWVDIRNVSDDVSEMGKMKANVLKPMRFAKAGKFESEAPVKLGSAMYQSLTELLNINRNKALLLITTGEIGEQTFEVYEENILYTYARQNAIPVYVILLQDKNRDVFQSLADQTFGKLYTMKDLKQIQNLYHEIKDSKPLEYIVTYEGLNLKGLKNFWVNFHMKIKYKSMQGVNDTGYFVPEINLETLIDIKKEMTPKK